MNAASNWMLAYFSNMRERNRFVRQSWYVTPSNFWTKLWRASQFIFSKYCYSDYIRNMRCGDVFSMHGRQRKWTKSLVGNAEGKRLLGRSRRRWEDNIKMLCCINVSAILNLSQYYHCSRHNANQLLQPSKVHIVYIHHFFILHIPLCCVSYKIIIYVIDTTNKNNYKQL